MSQGKFTFPPFLGCGSDRDSAEMECIRRCLWLSCTRLSTQHLHMNEGAERHIMSTMGVRGSSLQSFFDLLCMTEDHKRKPVENWPHSEDRFIAGK